MIAGLLGIIRYFACSNLRKKRAQNRLWYIQNRQSIKAAGRAASRASYMYSADPDKKGQPHMPVT